MPNQRRDEGASMKLLSESPGWNGLQTLKSRLSGRLVGFSPDRRRDHRPSRSENDAAFFEDDMCYIFNAKLVIVALSENDYNDMDIMALSLLDSLNDIVNGNVIELQETEDSPRFDPRGHSNAESHDVTCLAKYKRIRAMFRFLQVRPEARFRLVTGPGPSLFTLPPSGHGKVVTGRAKKWRAFLDRLAADAEISQGLQSISLQAIGISTDELADDEAAVLERRAGVVIDAMFREIRQLSCANVKTHEVKLRLSGLYTGPPVSVLDMFVSNCVGEKWHDAQCGSFPVQIEEKGKESLCAIIPQAIEGRRKLHLLVSQQGIFNVTDILPSTLSITANFTPKALKDLFLEKVFGQMTMEDYKNGAMEQKVGSKEKAGIALMLARCLMEFFDDDIELASHSWAPEQIYFLSHSATHGARGDLYVSLRPRLYESRIMDLLEKFKAGNPVLLSFARLMLEIDMGEKIPMDIHPENKDNEKNWAFLCGLVEWRLENTGNVQYLEAVKGCLHLCNNLPRSKDRAKGPVARKVLSRAIYEKIVRKLELIVNPNNLKRRRQCSISEYPQAKKPAAPSRTGIGSAYPSSRSFHNPVIIIPTQVEELDSHTLASFHTGKPINPEDWLEDMKRINRYIDQIKQKNFANTELRPIRIAILDSGCNLEVPYFRDDEESQRAARIAEWKDFVDGSEAKIDSFGHGTFMATLVIETAPLAELYIARVAHSTAQLVGMENNISQAIRWAGIECETDIISMSFGVTDGDDDIKQAILDVRKERKDSVIFLASAGNSGPHEDIAFPARHEGVTSIRATDHMGAVAGTNPTTNWRGAVSFATFGDNIPTRLREYNPEVCHPGSSVSTAIAAGIAATMLAYVSLLQLLFPNNVSEDDLKRLCTVKGIENLFLTLSTDVGNRIQFINLVKFFADRKTNFRRLCAIVECIDKAT